MTIDISNNTPRISYSVAAGVTQTSFAVPFEFFVDTDLNVYVDEALQTITTNYTVSGGDGSTGTVTMTVTGAKTVIITRDTTIERTTDFTAGVDINRAALNTQLDTLTAIGADVKDLAERSIRIKDFDPSTASLELPAASVRADKLLSFDTEGNVQTQAASDLLTGSVLGANYTKASHTGDGTIVAFSTTEAAGSKNNIQVYIDGVYQNKDTFSISGSTLTFTEAPPLNSAIEFIVGNAVTSLTTDPDVVTYNQGSTGAQDRTLTSKLQETVSVKDFGAVGDGVTDDTAAIQAAFTAANNKTLYLDEGNYLVTSQITIPANIVVFGSGRFTFTGDEDHWLKATSATSVVFYSLIAEVTLAFASRTNLNRVLFVSDAEYVEIKSAKITGASTAIDTSFGDALICGDIRLFNVQGTAPQYGYGINSSSKRTQIQNLYIKNDDTTNGRHGIYINGGTWEFFSVDNIYVDNWNENPVQITNTGTGNNCFAYVGNAVFQSCNYSPVTSEVGCINVGNGGSTATVKMHINSLRVRDIKGPAFGSLYDGLDNLYIGRLYAEELPQAANSATNVIHSRNGEDMVIDKIYVTELNTDWNSALYVRDTTTFTINDIFVGGSAGTSAITSNSSTIIIGHVSVDSIADVSETGSTIYYKELQQGIGYGGAAPTSGTYERGDIVWDSTPSAGGFMGWVCVTAGTPGTWKTFGAISA